MLPTPAFNGLADGEELVVWLERGKSLVIRLLGRAEGEDGQVKLFFELNGQPRVIKVARSGAASAGASARRGGQCRSWGRLMPGMVSSVAARVGQTVHRGDTLMTLEAMKMELAIRAERDGVVKAVHVSPGTPINAKELLMEFAA